MRTLWREAGVAALLCGTLAACASPHYPIDERDAAGPAPLTMARPQYPIAEDAAPPTQAAATPERALDEAPSEPPLAAPVAPVQTQSLPPPGPSAAAGAIADGGAKFQLASLTTEGAPPNTTAASAPATAAPVSSSLPPPAPPSSTPASSTSAAVTPDTVTPATTSTANPTPDAAASAAPAPAPAAEPSLTPQMVIHDQASPPATPVSRVRQVATSSAPTAQAPDKLANAGQVIDATGGVYENYEVQPGDHIDALARAFSTTRDVLIDINHLREPYVIRPGQIMKVPVVKAYVARGGDTLASVARRFSVGTGELAQLNRISERAALRAGQEIGLPSSMRDRGAAGGDVRYAESPLETPLPRSGGYTPTPPRRYAELPPSQPSRPSASYGYQAGPSSGSTVQVAPSMSDSEISTAARGRFVWPVRGDLAARFGPAGVGRRNDGVDIRAAQGTVVKAAAPGEVVYAGNQVPGFGNLVLVKHADGWVTAYAYLDQVDVQMKQQVAQGQAVGTVGSSGGVATQPELHFEVRYAPTPADKARPVDPVLVLPTG